MLDWIFDTRASNGKTGAELDAEIQALNERALQQGIWTREQYEQANANLQQPSDREQLNEAFLEGWNEGAQNISKAVGGTINAAVDTTRRLIPWQVWAILIGGVVLWFLNIGGLRLFKSK